MLFAKHVHSVQLNEDSNSHYLEISAYFVFSKLKEEFVNLADHVRDGNGLQK